MQKSQEGAVSTGLTCPTGFDGPDGLDGLDGPGGLDGPNGLDGTDGLGMSLHSRSRGFHCRKEKYEKGVHI